MIRYGAKTIAAGGFYSIPQFHGDGFLLTGDSAGFLNSQRLKGIHTAIKSGMLAAQAIFEALLTGDFSRQQLKRYRQLIRESWITTELKRVRNFHAAFKHGRWLGLVNSGLQFVTGGRAWGLFDRASLEPGHTALRQLKEFGYRGDDLEQRYGNLRFDG
jgi:electron-transferring-flavoprotein dehydrogenase